MSGYENTGKQWVSRLAPSRCELLTDIQVSHGKIPTSVLQGPFLPSVAEIAALGCRNAIPANLCRNLGGGRKRKSA